MTVAIDENVQEALDDVLLRLKAEGEIVVSQPESVAKVGESFVGRTPSLVDRDTENCLWALEQDGLAQLVTTAYGHHGNVRVAYRITARGFLTADAISKGFRR